VHSYRAVVVDRVGRVDDDLENFGLDMTVMLANPPSPDAPFSGRAAKTTWMTYVRGSTLDNTGSEGIVLAGAGGSRLAGVREVASSGIVGATD
jgi:hypothetical protein